MPIPPFSRFQPTFLTCSAQQKNLFQYRLLIACLLVGLAILILVAQLIKLQFLDYKKYTTLSQNNQIKVLPLRPKRGLILDRNGNVVAENMPTYTLDVVPNQVSHLGQTLQNLKAVVPLSKAEIDTFKKQQLLHLPFQAISLKSKLSQKQIARFYVNQHRFPGVQIHARLLRHYPLKDLLLTPLGYMGRLNRQDMQRINANDYSGTDYIGKSGIEKYYESLLHGKVGYQRVEIDAGGHIIRVLKKYPAVKGEDIYLSIDSRLQAVAKKAFGPHRGSLIAINPKNGEILVLFNHPSFDPNQLTQGVSQKILSTLNSSQEHALFNIATQGQFAPGSTVKPFLALGAISLGLVNPSRAIYDPGWYKIPHTQYIYHDLGIHKWVDLKKAITVSCDTYFYQLALNLGIEKMHDILSWFQFGQPVHIDLLGTKKGLLPTRHWKIQHHQKPWYWGDTIVVGIGQGYLLATPLQLALATSILAGRGRWFHPHLILKRKATTKNNIVYFQPKPGDAVKLKNKAWETVIQAMEEVIRSPNGTGRRFGRHPAYTVAGKTGTAQLYHLVHRHFSKPQKKGLKDNSLFIAFAPVQNPKIALAVIVEHAPDAPAIARAVIDAYLVKKPLLKGTVANGHLSVLAGLKSPSKHAFIRKTAS